MKYQIVIADPPWRFRTWSVKGKGRSPKYPTLSVTDIANLPIRGIIDKNAALFLWVTWPHLENGLLVLERWGFSYRTNAFVWFKTNKDGLPKIAKGYYTRKSTEVCLLGVRGKMSVHDRSVSDAIHGTPGPHSAKPVEFYRRVERLYPSDIYQKRVELFVSRNSVNHAHTFGYDPIGFDIDGRDIRDVLREITR